MIICKHFTPILILILFPIFSFAQYSVHTSDVKRFWQAYDSVQLVTEKKDKMALIQKIYVDPGTIGLKEFMELRGGKAEFWLQMMKNDKEGLDRVRPYTLSVLEQKSIIDQKLENFRRIYPELEEGDVYFTIGIGNTGGTTKDKHVLIGCEVVANEKPDWAVWIVMHEFVHTQQKNNSNGHLLSHCIMEGMADFIAELCMEKPLREHFPGGYIDFGLTYEEEVWKEFKKDIHNISNHGGWLYGGGNKVIAGQTMKDMGYYMGYRIFKSYYDQQEDKQQAIKDMLHWDLSDDEGAREFLLESGYVPAKDQKLIRKFAFKPDGEKKYKRKVVWGYKTKGEQVVFSMKLPKEADPAKIDKITVAGTFNGWKPDAEGFQMKSQDKRKYTLSIPKDQLAGKDVPAFKFVVNGTQWIQAPPHAKNVDNSNHRNLTIDLKAQ